MEGAPPLDQMVKGSAHVNQGDNSTPWSVPKKITRMPARFVSPVEVGGPQPPPHDDAIALMSLVLSNQERYRRS
ncbi:hypothetical protein E2562_031564 [Oryza meyeriana var. granulata]|uniref:Uncharacterized protein n=1 Tax=Oryza meyeriana var. granulata TaxID=110450 RepID=A0A6G1CVE9_9ORYZ|nr:hypothetical protein E2562_031564 [Oryza meyeriana var. granulata]